MQIRPATSSDVDDIVRIVHAAYAVYSDRIGRPPAPMAVDYRALVADTEHVVVLVDDTEVAGVLVSMAQPDHLLIENVAVAPWAQGRGHGRTLLAHAEDLARTHGLTQVRLYTNAQMTENLRLYPKLGYTEMDRRTDNGYHRVYFIKTIGR